ncbi:unnamed protein product [Mytilus edulis]|uniref:CCHC-type domain-containing protein n=1 Tax=Mytilus edulis TaxID=6550 RepID=A0A8S3SCZ1_MYTED|nr:unnamed protein product [Mytilus edulis]
MENKVYWNIPPMKPPRFSESPRRKVHSRRDTPPLDRGSIHHFPSFVRGPLGNLFYDLFIHLLKGFNQVRGRGENLVSRVKVSLVQSQSSISSTRDIRETSREVCTSMPIMGVIFQLDLEQPSAQGHAQGPRLPASASEPYINATPTGEVQIRVKKAGEGCYERQEQRCIYDQPGTSYENTRTDHYNEDLIQINEPTGRAVYGDKVAAGLVARERTINQQVSHGRGDIHINTGIGDVENQRLTRQRAPFPRFYSPSRSEERAPKDFTGVEVLQEVSQGPKWTHTVPSEGMRGNPWKIHTGTEDPRECTGHARESFRTVPTGGDILGYRDNQGFSQGSYGMTNDYGDNYRGDNTVTRGNNSRNKSYSSNKKPATFDGTSSWQDYLVHFEMVAEINGWDNISKALELATCLRGSAQAILSDLRPDLRRSFTHLVTALASRFQPSNQAELYRAQMKSTTREKNQSLPELAQDIKKLTRLAYPTAPMEVREQLARDCFIDSLNDADLEWAIFQGKPISIDDSVRIGLEFEAFANGHRRKFNNRAGLRMQTGMIDVDEQDDYQQMNSIMDRIAKIESNRGPNQSQKTDFLCYFCGKAGHFKRDCRKFLDMQKNGKYLPNNRFETSKWSQGTQTENFKSGNYTGSTLTVIHVRKFLSIPESQRPDKIYKGVQLKLANGEIITTFGQADFDIEINGQKFQQRFVIADIDAPAIVGYNFLYNKDCKLDIRESKLTIGSKNMEIICQKESNMVNIFKLATEETTVIPPRSEVLIFSKVVGDSTHLVQATVEPVDTKDKLLVARSLVDPSQGRIILRIANTSNFEKTVQKNTCLAECQAYADVTEPACEPAAASQNIFKLTDKITNKSNSDSLPDHLVDLFKSGSKLLSETQTLQFQRLLQKHSNAFAKSKNDLGCTDMIQHKINTGNATPVKQNPRRLPVTMQEEADRELSRMLDAGVIEPSMSPWAAPIVLVRKKDGSVRYCIDFRKINSLTKRDSYPLPRTQDCLEALHGSWYSTIDLQSGYWQVPVDPVDREKNGVCHKARALPVSTNAIWSLQCRRLF